MTDEPQRKGPGEDLSRGAGCVLGGLATVLIGAIGSVLGLSLFGGEGGLAAVSWLLTVAVLVGVAIYFRRVPGFLLGIAATIGIQIVIAGVIAGACAALLMSQFG